MGSTPIKQLLLIAQWVEQNKQQHCEKSVYSNIFMIHRLGKKTLCFINSVNSNPFVYSSKLYLQYDAVCFKSVNSKFCFFSIENDGTLFFSNSINSNQKWSTLVRIQLYTICMHKMVLCYFQKGIYSNFGNPSGRVQLPMYLVF